MIPARFADVADVPAWLMDRLVDPAPRQLPLQGNRASAVLIPVLNRPDGPTLLMVRKSTQLRKHAGQVAFPGGAVDAGESAEQAALREAREEVGLPETAVRILGTLDDERTYVTDFHIRPVVGWVASPPPTWTLDQGEIDSVLEVTLRELIATEPCSWMEFTWRGKTFAAPRWEWVGGRVVWGATGRVLHNLRTRLKAL